MTNNNTTHEVAPDAGRNIRCTCGAEYSLAANLLRHIATANTEHTHTGFEAGAL